MSEVISSFMSLRAGSQVFALFMLFLCVILHTMSLCKYDLRKVRFICSGLGKGTTSDAGKYLFRAANGWWRCA